jgi:hypothetical protein
MALPVTPERRSVELARCVPVPADVAIAILGEEPHQIIGSRLPACAADQEGYARLGVAIPGGRRIAREVRVGFGRLLEDDGAVALPVWWEDAMHPDLFPTFDGGLELRPVPTGTELRLVGSYQPPLGAFGRFADGMVGHRVVAASLETFLATAAERLLAAVGSPSPVPGQATV